MTRLDRALARSGSLAALLVLAAASGCDRAPPPPVGMTVALIPAGGWLAGETAPASVSLTGAILEAGDGAPPDGAFVLGKPLIGNLLGAPVPETDAWWLRMADADSRTWTVALYVEGAARFLGMGETVSLDLADGIVEVRDPAGLLVAWIGSGELAPLMVAPAEMGLEIVRTYADDFGCGTTILYDFRITVEGETTLVPYGEEAVIGSRRFLHGGAHDYGRSSAVCDYIVPPTAAALLPAADPE